jgi:hypothetical protein
MNTDIKPTTAQMSILMAAAGRADGAIEPLPDNLRGGARTQVIKGLLAKGFIVESNGHHVLTDAGYAAVGKRRPIFKGVQKMDTHDGVVKRDAPDALQELEGRVRAIRPGTKILTLVELLQEPGGASIVTLLQATGWLPHTIRGAISAIVKKKLGFRVISEKGLDGERIYKIDISTPKAE